MNNIAQIQSNKTNPKSKLTFRKWTKKMSKNEKSNKVLKNALQTSLREHNALKPIQCLKKCVTIHFMRNNSAFFSFYIYRTF
jgi:hypothetical protein